MKGIKVSDIPTYGASVRYNSGISFSGQQRTMYDEDTNS